jgi:hypothetical protein
MSIDPRKKITMLSNKAFAEVSLFLPPFLKRRAAYAADVVAQIAEPCARGSPLFEFP